VTRTSSGRIRVQPGAGNRGLRPIQLGGPSGAAAPYPPDSGPGFAGGPAADTGPGGPGDDVRLCQCGRRNPAGARFCPCGRTLVRLEVGTRSWTPDVPVEAGWRGAGDRRRFDGELRAAAGGQPRGYDRPLATRTVALRCGSALVLVVLLLASLSGGVRGRVTDGVAGMMPHAYRQLAAPTAHAEGPGALDLPGYAPAFAVDPYLNTAWASAWPPPAQSSPAQPAAGGSCAGAQGQPTSLVLQFDEVVSVDRVRIRAGLSDDDPQHTNQYRPRQLAFQFGDQPCVALPLRDTADAQNLDVQGRDLRTVKVWVIDVYPPPAGQGADVAISGLDFLTKR
jgi:hypothetical protein